MSNNCTEVIFSDKAYNELIRESFSMDPVETGGMLLGYVVNSIWVVMEVVPPGYKNSIHQRAYFEYDQEFVNYLIPSISNSYKDPLQLLGLWHRHPGSMDYFSSTDDETNAEFAQRSKKGTLSGLVNIDPSFRLTMYHLDHFEGRRPKNVAYSRVNVEVGNDQIPDEFFELRYIDSNRSELHPMLTQTNTQFSQTRSVPKSPRNGGDKNREELRISRYNNEKFADNSDNVNSPKTTRTQSQNIITKPHVPKWMFPVGAALILSIGIFVGIKVAPLLNSSDGNVVQETEQSSGQKNDEKEPANRDSQSENKDSESGSKQHSVASYDNSDNGTQPEEVKPESPHENQDTDNGNN